MRRKSILSLVVAVALVAVIGVGATLAYFTDSAEEKNVITTGHVEIDLEEPIFHENTNGENKIENVVPNKEIVKDPTVIVKAGSEACYIRTKIEIVGLEDLEGKNAELIDAITFSEGWVLSQDGYYYYQSPITKNAEQDQSIQFFEKVTIPAGWGNEVADKTIEINVSAEAVQADYFEPTTDADGVITGWPM